MKKDKSCNRNKRKFRITTAISAAVVIAIAVFTVLLCYKINWSYDMTVERLFTLSGQSVKVLDSLDEDVRIAGVYPAGKEEKMIVSLLNEYVKATDKISVEYIDVEQEPAKLAAYNLDVVAVTNGSIIVQSGSRSKIIDKTLLFEDNTGEGSVFNGEREITGAIRYVTSQQMPVIYFVQGNGEADPSVTLTKAVASLEQDAFEVRSLRLTEGEAIPDDAALLVFVSPKADISDDELSKIQDYTRKGGSVFVMIDPMNTNAVIFNNINKLMNEFGIGIVNNYVVEEDSIHYLSNRKLYLIPLFGSHEITKQIAEQDQMVILPIAAALSTTDYDKTEITNTALLQSSDKSWIRVDMTITDANQAANDYLGPAPLAYASVKSNVKWGNNAARMVVIGNSSFIYDGNFEVQANRNFFLNCTSWLSGDRETDIISSKVINSGTIIIRGSEFTGLAVVCIAVLPGLAFIAAFAVWMLRRNQ